MRSTASGLVAIGILIHTATALAAADPAVTCQVSKLKAAGKYDACRLNAESKAAKTGDNPQFLKCVDALAKKWIAAEAKAGVGGCFTEDDLSSVASLIVDHTDDVAVVLDGAIPAGEGCPATGQTTSYGPGDDGDLQPGATLAYTDNGDGTITDFNTGLMWEKKVAHDVSLDGLVECVDETATCADPHNANNTYRWTAGVAGAAYDGTVVTVLLEQLNDRCDQDVSLPCSVDSDCVVPGGPCGFAGHRDWRLPSIKELAALWHLGVGVDMQIDPAFHGASCGPACTDITDPDCSCTRQQTWSSTTSASSAFEAWYMHHGGVGPRESPKDDPLPARAVRGM